MCRLLGERGWPAAVASASDTRSDDGRLTFDGREAAFVVNRSTDFFWRSDALVGPTRLRRLVRQGDLYVAQKRIAKSAIRSAGADLWTDLRVWAYRGEIVLLSGRASRRPDRLDLAPPGRILSRRAGELNPPFERERPTRRAAILPGLARG
ncbi:MAG TPA: hypothetical protein VFE63_17155 [Roseiarcus sp.]|jgi:hypothetical protein|nr:hypothetical protein [Roseiarcus sp.]